MGQTLTLRLNGMVADTEVEESREGLRVRLGDRWHAVDFLPAGRPGLYSLLIDGRSFEVYARQRPAGWEILIGTRVFPVDISTTRAGRTAAPPEPEGVWTLRSPMSGIVVETLVTPGSTVTAGQVVVVVESMKMNNELTAARAGRVTEISVAPGDRVEKGTSLLRIE